MKQVISVKDLEEMVRSGRDVGSLPADALLTPSARDFLRHLDGASGHKSSKPEYAKLTAITKPVNSKSSKGEVDAFFNSAPIQELKLQICDIGAVFGSANMWMATAETLPFVLAKTSPFV